MSARYLVINGTRVIDPRHTRAWRKLRDQVVREEPVCWLRLEGCTITSTTGDHIIPVADRPDLALVRTNVRGACAGCNERRNSLPVSALRLEDRAGNADDVFG